MKLQIDILLKRTESIEERGYLDTHIEQVFHVPTKRVMKNRPFPGATLPPWLYIVSCIRFTIDAEGRLSKEQQEVLGHGGYDVTILSEEQEGR
jgi:hypothetical protein